MVSGEKAQSQLIGRYVAAWQELDDMVVFQYTDPIGWDLVTGEELESGFRRWRPQRVTTDKSALDPLYRQVPARFPRIYEHLVLSYRWANVYLQSYTLLANPKGPDLSGLFKQGGLFDYLLPVGYVQFGNGPGGNYDAVCFDTKSERNGDQRIVRIDHEEVLCNNRIRVVAELAPSFEELVQSTIEQAELKNSR